MNLKLKAFLEGFSSILNVSGKDISMKGVFTPEDDAEMRKGWALVNEGIQRALKAKARKGKN